jgi:predicted short-subunit dehydrogenase-like oxidoreductase (DUF2520 family)
MYQNNISFAGAGKVAEALSGELLNAGYRIDKIVSRSEERGRSLASSRKATWSSDLVFPDSTRIILVSVPDHNLKEVLHNIRCSADTVVAHTAGSCGMDLFPEHIIHKGVFYPLQTFSQNRKVGFQDIPVLLEASDDEAAEILKNLAEAVSRKVYFVDLNRRMILHLAAIFICNFTNHMFTLGSEIASKADFKFDIFIPLIKETIAKAIEAGPQNSQTGPAVRHDLNTIEKHMDLLSFSPELQGIYKEMTESIIEYYKATDTSNDKR